MRAQQQHWFSSGPDQYPESAATGGERTARAYSASPQRCWDKVGFHLQKGDTICCVVLTVSYRHIQSLWLGCGKLRCLGVGKFNLDYEETEYDAYEMVPRA